MRKLHKRKGGETPSGKPIKVGINADGTICGASEPWISHYQIERLQKDWWTGIRTVERMCEVKYIVVNPHFGVFVPWWAWEANLRQDLTMAI